MNKINFIAIATLFYCTQLLASPHIDDPLLLSRKQAQPILVDPEETIQYEGTVVEEILDGFSAKVFQHELDHLQGHLTIDHPEGSPHSFETPQSFIDHMHQIHTEDSKSYQRKSS